MHIDRFETVDIAIVGGGVAGCYTGYRLMHENIKQQLSENSPMQKLLENKKKLNIALYEYSDRIGGRLLSVDQAVSDVCAEFGGMRFSAHAQIVFDLIKQLGLEKWLTDFRSDEDDNFVYIRDVHFRQKQLTAKAIEESPEALPYDLKEAEKGKTASHLILMVANQLINGFSSLRENYQNAFQEKKWELAQDLFTQYQKIRDSVRINGKYLYQLSWWELLLGYLSQEALAFMQDSGGYEIYVSSGNAAAQLDRVFYTPSTFPYQSLSVGFDKLPKSLHKKFSDNGGKTRFLHQLLHIDKIKDADHSRVYELLFQRRQENGEVHYTQVKAKVVILAIPKPSLELLAQNNNFFDNQVLQEKTQSVLSINALKLFMVYPHPWWEEKNVNSGRCRTDLPIRQFYCFGKKDNITPNQDLQYKPSLVMASYTSGSDTEYWHDLQKGELYQHDKLSFFKEICKGKLFDFPDNYKSLHPAPRAMVERSHKMLMETFNVNDAPMPISAFFKSWSDLPFGAGWHVWKPGYKESEVIPYMRSPFPEEKLYIVGSCWSNRPGSVHGALNVCECMLQDNLGLVHPQWLQVERIWLGS